MYLCPSRSSLARASTVSESESGETELTLAIDQGILQIELLTCRDLHAADRGGEYQGSNRDS